MTTSCQIGFSIPITSDVFALDIEGLHNNGCDIVNGTNGDKICADMAVVGRRVKQGPASFFDNYVFQELPDLPLYTNQGLLVYAIEVLVKLNKVSIIASMHEYAYLGKDKFFQSSDFCKNIVTIKSMTVCPSLPYDIVMTNAEVGSMLLHDVCDVLICYHGNGPTKCNLCLAHLDNIDSSVSQAVSLWILERGAISRGAYSSPGWMH